MEKLTAWEKRYLLNSHGRGYVTMPRDSPVTDGLWQKGVISGFGFVMGRYVDYMKTAYGELMLEGLLGNKKGA